MWRREDPEVGWRLAGARQRKVLQSHGRELKFIRREDTGRVSAVKWEFRFYLGVVACGGWI